MAAGAFNDVLSIVCVLYIIN